MSRLESLQERLRQLEDNAAQLTALIGRLADAGAAPPPAADDDDAVAELAADIRLRLREQDDDLTLLRDDAAHLRPGRPGSPAEHHKARLLAGVAGLEAELKTYGPLCSLPLAQLG